MTTRVTATRYSARPILLSILFSSKHTTVLPDSFIEIGRLHLVIADRGSKINLPYQLGKPNMNRKKKVNSILKKRLKKAKAKMAPKAKSTYVSKAERERIALEENKVETTEPGQDELTS